MSNRRPGADSRAGRNAVLSLSIAALLAVAVVPGVAQARKKKDSLLGALAKKVDAALVQAPQDGETCFSPDEPCDVKLLKFVDSASVSIDMAVYDINRDQLVHRLLLQARKIPVRLVVDRRQAKGDHSLVPTLIKGGIRLRFGRQRGVMHNKFTIVDGKRLETGSFNYTNNASENNNENQVYLGDPAIVDRYRKRFEQIWERAAPPKEGDLEG